MLHPRSFIDDSPLQAFTCKVARFQAYRLEIIDGKHYIVGVGKAKDGGQTFFIEKHDEPALLVSLLTLYEQLDANLYGHVEERIQSVDVDRITGWCKRYGMPMEASTMDEDSIWRKYGKVGFLVSAFYNQLNNLYICYLLWRRIAYDDVDIGNYYTDTPIDTCKVYLQVRMLTLNICLHPDFSQYPPSYHLECENYMTVAQAHMFFLCMSPGTPYIGVCAVCGEPFAKRRKNNTLCERCRQTKSKRSRERKRLKAQNGTEKK